MENLMRFFEQHQSTFAQQHHRKFVLIRQPREPKIVDFFPSYRDAYASAVFEAKIPPETFLIRRCLWAEEEQPAVFHSRVR